MNRPPVFELEYPVGETKNEVDIVQITDSFLYLYEVKPIGNYHATKGRNQLLIYFNGLLCAEGKRAEDKKKGIEYGSVNVTERDIYLFSYQMGYTTFQVYIDMLGMGGGLIQYQIYQTDTKQRRSLNTSEVFVKANINGQLDDYQQSLVKGAATILTAQTGVVVTEHNMAKVSVADAADVGSTVLTVGGSALTAYLIYRGIKAVAGIILSVPTGGGSLVFALSPV